MGGRFLPVGLAASGGGSRDGIADGGCALLGGVLLDPIGPALVAGGAAGVAALRSTGRDCRAALAALGPCLRARPDADMRAARVAVNRIVERASATGLATAERAPVVERFLARAATELADARDPDAFRRWGEEEVLARAERHEAAQAVWRAAADAAPAMGMMGTVFALIGMFSGMDDPARIGPGMALALTTTLWGIIVANLLAGPVAARLERLSKIEIDWQEKAVARLVALAESELGAPPVETNRRLRVVA